jgi:hypothetical protein
VKTVIDKQLKFWKTYGIYSPLVFVVGLIVCWLLDWFNIETWFVIGGTVLACTAVVWWWWTMFTIGKLNSTLTRNVEQFLELLNIVKELNHEVKETSSNRQRGIKKTRQTKSTKE